MRPLVAAALLGLGLLGASSAHAEEAPGAPPPPKELTLVDGMRTPSGYTVVERTQKGPIIAGAVMFGSSYLLSVSLEAIASAYATQPDHNLYVPVLGPFMQMRGGDSVSTLILASDGLTQAVGLGLLVYGLVVKKHVLVRDDLVVAPMVSSSGSGLVVAGRF